MQPSTQLIERRPQPRIALTDDERDWWARRKSAETWRAGLPGIVAPGVFASGGVAPVTPLSILGSSLLFADYWAADRDDEAAVNPRITLVTGVSSWPEEATRTAAAVQSDTAKQPALSATSFGGKPGVTFDGSDDTVFASLSSPIVNGSRAYVFVVGNWTTTSVGAGNRRVLCIADAANTTAFDILGNTTSGGQMGGYVLGHSDASGTDLNFSTNPTVLDTGRHVWEWGTLASTTNEFVQDGVGKNGTRTAPLGTNRNRIYLGSSFGAACGPVVLHRVIIAHNPASITDVPSAAQLTAMRALLSGYL